MSKINQNRIPGPLRINNGAVWSFAKMFIFRNFVPRVGNSRINVLSVIMKFFVGDEDFTKKWDRGLDRTITVQATLLWNCRSLSPFSVEFSTTFGMNCIGSESPTVTYL